MRDSISYLDHINGKKQQKMLGMSMRVERSNVHQVKDRLKFHKEQAANKKRVVDHREEYDERIRQLVEEDELEREARREAKRKALHLFVTCDSSAKEHLAHVYCKQADEEEAARTEGVDPEVAAMMGFNGFGSKK
eukprot:scaffold323_cov414-Prasinococcus_capsulatus_cf.AAC.60